MNKKGQMSVGLILITFIAILVGIILFQVIAQQVGRSTTLDNIANMTIGTQTNGTTYYFANYQSITDVVIYGNASGISKRLDANNYTITNNVINPSNAQLSVGLLPSSADYTATSWNISGTGTPTTYITNSGARGVAGIIAIMFALAIAVVALEPTLRSKVLDMMK